MGIGHWIAQNDAKQIVKAMARNFRQAQIQRTNQGIENLPALCRAVIQSRYKRISPGKKESAIIRKHISQIADLYDAAFLVVLAEENVCDRTFYELYAETVTHTIAKMEGIAHPKQDEAVRARLTDLIQTFASILSEAPD